MDGWVRRMRPGQSCAGANSATDMRERRRARTAGGRGGGGDAGQQTCDRFPTQRRPPWPRLRWTIDRWAPPGCDLSGAGCLHAEGPPSSTNLLSKSPSRPLKVLFRCALAPRPASGSCVSGHARGRGGSQSADISGPSSTWRSESTTAEPFRTRRSSVFGNSRCARAHPCGSAAACRPCGPRP